MLWAVLAFLGVGAVKYYTALGSRNLERRLNRVKSELDDARERLKAAREKQAGATEGEEEETLRVRYMKEMIDDIKVRLSTRDDSEQRSEEKKEEILLMR